MNKIWCDLAQTFSNHQSDQKPVGSIPYSKPDFQVAGLQDYAMSSINLLMKFNFFSPFLGYSSKQYFWFTDLITDMSMETVYAGTVEQLSGFVLQIGFAGAVVLTLVFLAAS